MRFLSFPKPISAFFLAGLACAYSAALPTPRDYIFRHENVLGTSLELRVRADTPDAAEKAEAKVLAEIDRLSGIASSYAPTSEFSRWQQTRGTATKLSIELFELLTQAEHWQKRSGGVFNPGVESLTRAWQEAARQGQPPSPVALDAALGRATAAAWSLDPITREATHLSDCPLTLNAVAKGYIIDHAGAAACAAGSGVRGLLLNIGGDLRAWGELETPVNIADPRHDAENAGAMASVRVRQQAIATSGNYRRGVEIQGRSYSHIIDPRNGQPAADVLSATVIAPDAATAGPLATILNILSPEEVAHRTDLKGIEWMVVRADGTTLRSPGWPEMLVVSADTGGSGSPATPAPPTGAGNWPGDFEMAVNFELNQPGSGRFARPYVALWVEDKDGFPVRTLILWLMQGRGGQRWLPDLRRWYKSDQLRAVMDTTDLAATVSSATRQPGKYTAVWDGTDDHKRPVKRGTYTVYLEAVREHGTYQLMRKEVTVGTQPFREELQGNIEVKSATLEYRQRPAAK